jgi:DNA-binding NtrC family response regulator
MNQPHVLIAEDEAVARRHLETLLAKEGCRVTAVADGTAALAELERGAVDLVLTDLRMPGADGLAVLAAARRLHPQAPVILLTAYGSIPSAVRATRQGAFDYLAKPFTPDELRVTVRNALAQVRLAIENRALRDRLAGVERPIVTADPAMRRVIALAERAAVGASTVLITGESGTGKELIARLIHARSPRREAPFQAVNCGAYDRELVASELFGHEKGAFTGAVAAKPGMFELAEGGTLFLDEVAELPADAQVKLLRAVQEREVLRVGATRPNRIDVRLVAATNADLARAVADGRLRQDLLYRLKVVHLHLPPLRDRPADIAPLARHFVARHATRQGRSVDGIDDEALAALAAYGYPGNVRELENIIESGVALAAGTRLTLADLPEDLRELAVETYAPVAGATSLAALNEAHVSRVLAQCGGNRTRAAAMLGVDRVTLWRWLRRRG